MKINNSTQLHDAIELLEYDENIKKKRLLWQLQNAREGLRPINILKNSLENIVKFPVKVDKVILTGVLIGAVILSKTLIGKIIRYLKMLLSNVWN